MHVTGVDKAYGDCFDMTQEENIQRYEEMGRRRVPHGEDHCGLLEARLR